jgi:4-amino-4-deoxy-L-arabinose transferase-like glycosyltransferase
MALTPAAAGVHALVLALTIAIAFTSTRDRMLTGIVALSGFARAGLAFALYLLSSAGGPILQDLQLGGGFWSFAPDSLYYHRYAMGAAVALRHGLELPFVYGTPDYPLIVTGIYRVFGTHPLFAVALNTILASMTVLLAYLLARSLWTRQGARVSAALIAFWPSSVLWSTQLLKDTFEVFLVVAFLYLFNRIVEHPTSPGRERLVHRLGLVVATCIVLGAAYMLRFYIGLLLAISALAALASAASIDLTRGRYRRAIAGAGLAGCFVGAVWATTWVVPDGLAKPSDPVRTSRRLAAHMVSIRDIDGALWQLETALLQEAGAPTDAAARTALARAQLNTLMAGPGDSVASHTGGGGGLPAEASHDDPPRDSRTFLDEMSDRLSLARLQAVRTGFFKHTGSFIADPRDTVNTLGSLIALAPQALTNALLTPNPWTRFQTIGSTGPFRHIAVLEVALVPFLLYFGAAAVKPMFVRQWQLAVLIVLFAGMLTAALGYTVPTVGVLFRLRLAVLIPLCLLAGGSALPDYVLWFRNRLRVAAMNAAAAQATRM